MYVMVKQIDDHRHIIPRWTVSSGLWDMYFWVDDVDMLYKEFVERGAKIDYGLCDQRYGCREFGTQDYRRARYRVRAGPVLIARESLRTSLGRKRVGRNECSALR